MVEQNEQRTKILKVLLIGWVIILCVTTVLIFPVFSIKFTVGKVISTIIGLLSLVLAVLNIRNRRCVSLGIVSLVLGSFIFFIGRITSPPTPIYNPFSSQQFAVTFDSDIWNTTGIATYYRRWGSFLYDPKETEHGELLIDNNYVQVAQNDIYVNATFMGVGESFDAYNAFVDLRRSNVEEWCLEHENDTCIESFELTETSPHVLVYRTTDDEHKEYNLTDEEYLNLRQMLEVIALVDNKLLSDKDAFSYILQVSIKEDSAIYCAPVDGEKVFALMQQYIGDKEKLLTSLR